MKCLPALLSVVFLCFLTATRAQIDNALADDLLAAVQDASLLSGIPPPIISRLQEKIKRSGCAVNVCFGLDGSLSVGDNFGVQKDFVRLITALVGGDRKSQFAGTVFGLTNLNIDKLNPNALDFLGKVDATMFPSAPVTFLTAGLVFCINELNDPEEAKSSNKIVLVSDGFANFGDFSGPLSPVPVANQWTSVTPRNEILAIAAGPFDITKLVPITGSADLVFDAKTYPGLGGVFEDVMNKICGLKPGPIPKPTPSPSKTPKPSKVPAPEPTCPCKCFKTKTNKKGEVMKAKKRAKEQCRKLKGCAVSECGKEKGKYHCCTA